MKNNAKFCKVAFTVVLQICFYSSVVASTETVQAGSAIAEAATKVTAKTVLKAMPTFTLVYQVGGLGLQAVNYAFPTDIKKAQTLRTTDQLESVQAFEKFTTCLLTNPKRSSVIGELGIPIVCELAAKHLAKKGATHEVNQMIHFYKSPTIQFIIEKQ